MASASLCGRQHWSGGTTLSFPSMLHGLAWMQKGPRGAIKNSYHKEKHLPWKSYRFPRWGWYCYVMCISLEMP
jgi:hypothetical protein